MKDLPIVYSCSGCSSAAQLANHLALRLDRSGEAEMSCIVGVGGEVKPLLQAARSGRPILAIDGCQLHCVRHVLAKQALSASVHVDLSNRGVKKVQHGDFDAEQARGLLDEMRGIARRLRG